MAINEQKRLKSISDKCQYCMGSSTYLNYQQYVVKLGDQCIIRLKRGGARLHPFHCEIVPLLHTTSIRACEEEVVDEINKFKSILRRFAELHSLSMVFLEAAVRFRSSNHALMDCVPVESGKEQELRICFREVS